LKTDLVKFTLIIAAGLTAAAVYRSFTHEETGANTFMQKEKSPLSQVSKLSPKPEVQKIEITAPSIQTQSPASNTGTNSTLNDFAINAEVQELIKLQEKVFMTETEEASKKNLLQNENFFRGLRPLFSVTGDLGSDLAAAQNVAIDALINSKTRAASEVLESIVVDSTIENNQVPETSRQQLAELKADVLYSWSASDPEARERIPGLLPGSVSQKIWQNVLEAQQQNRAESLISAR
jgi:hypothetical protein